MTLLSINTTSAPTVREARHNITARLFRELIDSPNKKRKEKIEEVLDLLGET
jgi:hypothetical protein